MDAHAEVAINKNVSSRRAIAPQPSADPNLDPRDPALMLWPGMKLYEYPRRKGSKYHRYLARRAMEFEQELKRS